jgi:hypothetical protein
MTNEQRAQGPPLLTQTDDTIAAWVDVRHSFLTAPLVAPTAQLPRTLRTKLSASPIASSFKWIRTAACDRRRNSLHHERVCTVQHEMMSDRLLTGSR